MDPRYTREIERESAEALLDAGVSVPLLSFKLPFLRRSLTLRLTMRRPNLAGLVRIARIYNGIGVTSGEMWDFDKEAEMKFLADHGRDVARIIAVTFCRGRWAARWLERPLAWIISHRMPPALMLGAMTRFVLLMGTDPFIPIIRLAERKNPMKPRLSREAGGS